MTSLLRYKTDYIICNLLFYYYYLFIIFISLKHFGFIVYVIGTYKYSTFHFSSNILSYLSIYVDHFCFPGDTQTSSPAAILSIASQSILLRLLLPLSERLSSQSISDLEASPCSSKSPAKA